MASKTNLKSETTFGIARNPFNCQKESIFENQSAPPAGRLCDASSGSENNSPTQTTNKKKGDNIPDSPKWLDSLPRFVTLWDMIQFLLQEFVIQWQRICDFEKAYTVEAAKRGHDKLLPEDYAQLEQLKSDFRRICQGLRLESSQVLYDQFAHTISHTPCSVQSVSTLINGLSHSIRQDLYWTRFASVARDKVEFFDKGNCEPFVTDNPVFGEKVFEVFPEIRDEIRTAGTCFALNLYDATAFHLMRIVEMTLRGLARELGVRIPNTPLDFSGWEKVETGIDERLSLKIPKARGPKQTSALKFKHDLLADFRAFRVYRNEIMHCRWHCNPKEAEGLFIRVREFIQRIANRDFAQRLAKVNKRKK